jgi:superfamily II DNA or RNA helicase
MIKTTILQNGRRVKLRKHQKDAIHSVFTHYKLNSPRATISHCCRSGKSLTALTLHKSLKSKASVVFLPNLSLVEQTLSDWLPNIGKTKILIVCSDKSTYDGEVTADPKEIKEFIKNCGKSPFVIFSTYQSSKKMCQALKLLNDFSFDFLVADEAHRSSGVNLKQSRFVHYDDCIRATNRLYMTATPKVVSQQLEDQLHESAEVFSMDDKEVFGEEVHTYSFKDGIEDGILSDYKIVALGCKSPTALDILEDAETAEHQNIIETAKLKALKKALSKYKIDHCITFHSSVKKALFFKNNLKAKGWKTFHINGNMNAQERKTTIESFKKAKKAVMTNCRCLSEGISIRECDSVFFSDTKDGAVDVVQSASRPLTIDSNKPKGFKNLIILPTFHHATDSVEHIVNTSAYQTLIKLVKHMRGIDDRIDAFLMSLARGSSASYDMQDAIIEFSGFAKLQKEICSRIIPHDIVAWSDQELWDVYIEEGGMLPACRKLGVSGTYYKTRRIKSPWLDEKISAHQAKKHLSEELLLETLHKAKGNRIQARNILKPDYKGDIYQIRMYGSPPNHGELTDFGREVLKVVAMYDARLTDDEIYEAFVHCGGSRDKTHVFLGYEPRSSFISKRYKKSPTLREKCLKFREDQIHKDNDLVFDALAKAHGRIKKASEALGKSYAFVSQRLKRYRALKKRWEDYKKANQELIDAHMRKVRSEALEKRWATGRNKS